MWLALNAHIIDTTEMTAFVESCVQTAAGSAAAVHRHARGRPLARRLLKRLAEKKNILITAHMHPDPDALASSLALCELLSRRLKDAQVNMSIKGQIGGGINSAFTRHTQLRVVPWDDRALQAYDAIILLDTQPMFAYSPLPEGVVPTAVIDHHRARGRKPQCPFVDIRIDAGATSSIIFSYFMELEEVISPDLAATLLYGIETDLAGAAGTPGNLDNLALASLTLLADTRKLYQMRYVDLPQSYFISYFEALSSAVCYDNAMVAQLGEIDSLEKPAVVADFLLRYDQTQWVLVTAVHGNRLMCSLRTSSPKHSAGDIMRRLLREIGDGGGHRTKAGGSIKLENGSPTELDRLRTLLKRRLLRALKIRMSRGQRLVPKVEP
jgi:nanoRNase/pAp phosphatase (c-di-AMP/oligoRNAs hydrolase)